MAHLTVTRSEVRRLLALPDVEAVERLIQRGLLEIAGHTRRGLPLFDAEAVRRIAERAIAETATPR